MRTNHHNDEHDENQVLAWLRDADPVSDLPPLPSWQLEHVKETAMTASTKTALDPARGHHRRLIVASVGFAAAAAAIIGGIVVANPGTSPSGEVTALSAPTAGGPAAMCAELTPEALASSSLAFRGTVTSISDGLVTFRVDDVFTGDIEQTVTVPQGEADAPIDGAAPVFNENTTYLVSTTEDVIRSCGLTGEDSAALNTLYEQAF